MFPLSYNLCVFKCECFYPFLESTPSPHGRSPLGHSPYQVLWVQRTHSSCLHTWMCCGQPGLCNGFEVEGLVLSGSSLSHVWAGVRLAVAAYSLPSCAPVPFVFPPSPEAPVPAAESAVWPTWRQTSSETWDWVINLPSTIYNGFTGENCYKTEHIFQQNFKNLLVETCTLCQTQFNTILVSLHSLRSSHMVHFNVPINDSACLCICERKNEL